MGTEKGLKIIIVDDVKVHRMIMNAAIIKYNPDILIDQAESVDQAIELLTKHLYHIVLCDWNLGDKKGTLVLEWMRKRESFKHTPFIMISGNDTSEDISEAFETFSVDGYITKPFTIERLLKVIDQAYTERYPNHPYPLRS